MRLFRIQGVDLDCETLVFLKELLWVCGLSDLVVSLGVDPGEQQSVFILKIVRIRLHVVSKADFNPLDPFFRQVLEAPIQKHKAFHGQTHSFGNEVLALSQVRDHLLKSVASERREAGQKLVKETADLPDRARVTVHIVVVELFGREALEVICIIAKAKLLQAEVNVVHVLSIIETFETFL